MPENDTGQPRAPASAVMAVWLIAFSGVGSIVEPSAAKATEASTVACQPSSTLHPARSSWALVDQFPAESRR